MQEEMRKFLEMTNGSAELCLMIAKDEQELADAEQEATSFGFQKSKNTREMFNSIKSANKTYFILDSTLGNNIYNILAQYPTGQVTVCDGKNNLVANPDYGNGSVLILITKENLEKIEQGEKSLLKFAGLTWQN